MRPFERLRYLARMAGEDDETLLEEAAECLAGFADDPMGVVVACRRLLAYHPASTPLWWLSARVLGAPDPAEGAWAAWRDWRRDPTGGALAGVLPFPADASVAVAGWPDVVRDGLAERVDLEILAVRDLDDAGLSRRLRASLQPVRVVDPVELPALAPTHLLVAPIAAGGGRVLVAPGVPDTVAAARDVGAVVWLVVARGRALPERLFDAMLAAVAAGGCEDDAGTEWQDPDVDGVIGPEGLDQLASLAHRADCGAAPELLRL